MNLGGWSLHAALVYVMAATVLYRLGGRGWRPTSRCATRVLRRPVHDRDRAQLADRRLRGPAVLGAHGPARPAADRGAAVDPARPPVAADVARAAAQMRTTVGRRSRGIVAAPLRALGRPLPAWILFNGTLIAWHIPAVYDETLTSGTVHRRARDVFLHRAAVLGLGGRRWPAPAEAGVAAADRVRRRRDGRQLDAGDHARSRAHPLYGYYANLVSRPGGISALADQQLAAGVMWVLGSLAYTITFLIGFYRWLAPDFVPPAAPVPVASSFPPPQPIPSRRRAAGAGAHPMRNGHRDIDPDPAASWPARFSLLSRLAC